MNWKQGLFRVWLVLSALTFPACVDAAFGQAKRTIPDTFNCQIKQYFLQADSGLLKDQLRAGENDFIRKIKNATILVENHSGKMLSKAGFPFMMIANPDITVTVLEQGSEEQSYKVLYQTTGKNMNVAYLQIHTYRMLGSETPLPREMPFILVDGGSVYSGLCT